MTAAITIPNVIPTANESPSPPSCPIPMLNGVAGFAPAYVPCTPVEPEVIAEPEQGGGWRSWFGLPPRAAESPQTEPEQP